MKLGFTDASLVMVACTTFMLTDGMLFLAVNGGLEDGLKELELGPAAGVTTVGTCVIEDWYGCP